GVVGYAGVGWRRIRNVAHEYQSRVGERPDVSTACRYRARHAHLVQSTKAGTTGEVKGRPDGRTRERITRGVAPEIRVMHVSRAGDRISRTRTFSCMSP